MRKIFFCRRSSLALISIAGLLSLGFFVPEAATQVCIAISGICMGVAGANAYQGAKEKQYEGESG